MIHSCPHCGRAVANTEPISRVNGVWYPTACLNGDELPIHDPIVKNNLFFYCSAVNDSGRKSLLAGPYPDYESAERVLYKAKRKADEVDYRAPWYAYGIASSNNECVTIFGKIE